MFIDGTLCGDLAKLLDPAVPEPKRFTMTRLLHYR